MARLVVLNSTIFHTNVSYVKDVGELHQFLKVSGEDVGSPYAKFELEAAKSSGNEGLVNIRCLYNNKYWALNTGHFVVASADVPDEDVTKLSCTLFEPVYKEVSVDKTTVRFIHAQTRNFAVYRESSDQYVGCLYAGEVLSSPSTTWPTVDRAEFEVINLESLVTFPKYVTFKGDLGKYLGGVSTEGHQYHQYSITDIGNNRVGYEIFPTANRYVRIKSTFFGKFWKRHANNWIWAYSTDTSTNDQDTLFLPIKVSSNVVALRNMGNNQFCKRLTTDGKTDCLSASDPTISVFARMEVEEHVLSRNIYNVVYRLTESRIYGEEVISMATATGTNNTTEPNTMKLVFKYTDSWSRSWDASVSLGLSIKGSMQMGIPLIVKIGVEISAEFHGEYSWGETREETESFEPEYTVTVPPMTTVRVDLLATRGTCDVPFSYTQRDTLITGEEKLYNKDDGIYTGINSFNFTYEATPVPL